MEMPTYEFRCPRGHEFEKFYRTISSAESAAACPVCGQIAERMMSATGFAFKGSGFYLTDYGKNAHREKGTPSPSGSTSGDGAKDGGDGAKGESTPEPSKTAGTESSSSSPSPATSASEGKSAERNSTERKSAEPKAAPAPPKKSSGE
jgi:putative FmdB family regulatory protein